MKTPEEFYKERNGKHPETAEKEGETISPSWACVLLKEYAYELFKEKEMEIKELLKGESK